MKIVSLVAWMLASSAAVASPAPNALPPEGSQALHSNGHAILYSLEPWDKPDNKGSRLHGYEILGQSDLNEAQASTAVGAFDAAISGWDGAVAACFDPRHAIRIQSNGHTYDFLLCYSCHQMEVFRDDKMLADVGAAGSPKVLNDLLTSLRVPLSYSLKDMESSQQVENARNKAGLKNFLALMPASIRPFWDADANFRSGLGPFGKSMEALRAAFVSANPDRDAAIHTLLVWYGSGSGRWSGVPGYEEIAGQLLLGYPTDRIIAAAQAPDASDALLEGTARYLGGWDFSKRHPQDMSLVPASLRQRLLEHTLRTGDTDDNDRRDRAKRAFTR